MSTVPATADVRGEAASRRHGLRAKPGRGAFPAGQLHVRQTTFTFTFTLALLNKLNTVIVWYNIIIQPVHLDMFALKTSLDPSWIT